MNCRTWLLGSLVVLSGCFVPVPQGEDETTHITLKPLCRKRLLVIALDTSGSFVHEVFEKRDRAYRFTKRALQQVKWENTAGDARVLLAQISANRKPLLFEGTPDELQKRFPTSKVLKEELLKASDPRGSRLYAGVADVIDYVQALPDIDSELSEVVILVLSDMDDNSPTHDQDRQVMAERLELLQTMRGQIGFYYVATENLAVVRQCVGDAGLDPRFVESKIVENPPIPRFGRR